MTPCEDVEPREPTLRIVATHSPATVVIYRAVCRTCQGLASSPDQGTIDSDARFHAYSHKHVVDVVEETP